MEGLAFLEEGSQRKGADSEVELGLGAGEL